jgi:hypothetical protein
MNQHQRSVAVRIFNGIFHSDEEEDSLSSKALILLGEVSMLDTGYNIQAADEVIIWNPHSKWSTTAQAIGRSWRFGQDEAVLVWNLINRDVPSEVICHQAAQMHQELSEEALALSLSATSEALPASEPASAVGDSSGRSFSEGILIPDDALDEGLF